jgi:hypothetical protein
VTASGSVMRSLQNVHILGDSVCPSVYLSACFNSRTAGRILIKSSMDTMLLKATQKLVFLLRFVCSQLTLTQSLDQIYT